MEQSSESISTQTSSPINYTSEQLEIQSQIKEAESRAATYLTSASLCVNFIKQEMLRRIWHYDSERFRLIIEPLIYLMNGHCGAFEFKDGASVKPSWNHFMQLHEKGLKLHLTQFLEAVKGGYLSSKNVNRARSYFNSTVFTPEIVVQLNVFESTLLAYVRNCVDTHDAVTSVKILKKKLEDSLLLSGVTETQEKIFKEETKELVLA